MMGQINEDKRGQKFKKSKKDGGGRSIPHNASGGSQTEKQADWGAGSQPLTSLHRVESPLAQYHGKDVVFFSN